MELHVRGIPDELHERIRARAAAEGRSMSAEAIVLLRRALAAGRDQHARDRAIERLAELRRRRRLPADVPPAEDLVRDDRDVR